MSQIAGVLSDISSKYSLRLLEFVTNYFLRSRSCIRREKKKE